MAMNLRKSFQILEIGINATEEEVKEAYKDLVAVWHPDRFSHNPRLRKKAEEKIKEANVAYETVKDFFSAKGRSSRNGQKSDKAFDGESRETSGTATVSKTELAAEVGTSALLYAWSYLSKKVNHILSDDIRGKSR